MSYKIESLKVRNFKCFDEKKFYEFNFRQDTNPIILSGPNGFGKTTFFDAVELIFTKKITRLNADIEHKNTNLGKNILLNTSTECGYLVLTLISNNHERITIIAEIDDSLTKLTIDTSIRFTYVEGLIDIDDFDTFISDNLNWKDDISEFKYLNYIKEHFNIYYYVSQAESVHFLKNNISSRKDSLTKLLQTEAVNSKIDYLDKKLIGLRSGTKGFLINDELKTTKDILDTKLVYLKKRMEAAGETNKEISYSKLLMYPKDIEMKKWDLEIIDMKTVPDKQIDEYITEIIVIYNLYHDLNDYKTLIKNNEVQELSKNNEALKNYTKYYNYIIDNKIDIKQLEDQIVNLNHKIDAFMYSGFFRGELDISKYKNEDVARLKELKIIPDDMDIIKIQGQVKALKILNSNLGANNKKINELIEAREKLHAVGKNNPNLEHCPYCNSLFDNPELLESAYDALNIRLKDSQDDLSREIKDKTKELANYIKPIVESIEKLLGQNYNEEIEQIRIDVSEYSMLLKSEKNRSDISKIHKYVGKVNSWRDLDETSRIIELKRLIEENISDYINQEFLDNLKKLNYIKAYKENAELLSIEQPKLNDKGKVDDKISFLKYLNSLEKNTEIDLLKNEIGELIIKLKRLEKIRSNFDLLRIEYRSSINEYKNLVLKKLRVPLLIYTGKILQDYQNGLGVFINEDEMRFVSNGDAKHDILNTFSSGQLSGFVLSFLFAMNRRYISETLDDIGFILIDDPVQTMDDINIASFIEVLRNDFKDKQIILSTHETDKENYILYKFLKYNQKGQSFNVKDEMY